MNTLIRLESLEERCSVAGQFKTL